MRRFPSVRQAGMVAGLGLLSITGLEKVAPAEPQPVTPVVQAIRSQRRPPVITLGEAVSRFPARDGVRYRAVGHAAEQPVTLVLFPGELKAAPDMLARHFGFAWRSIQSGEGEIRELYAAPERQKLGAARRQAVVERTAEELTRQWDLWIQALEPGERGNAARTALRLFLPDEYLRAPNLAASSKLLATIPPDVRANLAREGRLISQAYREHSPDLRDLLDQIVPAGGGETTVTGTDPAGRVIFKSETNPRGRATSRFVLQVTGAVQNRYLSLTYWGSHTITRGAGDSQDVVAPSVTFTIGFGTGERREGKEPAEDPLEAEGPDQRDPALQKRVSFEPPPLYPVGGRGHAQATRKRAEGNPELKNLTPQAYVKLPDLLSKVAVAAKLSLIADSYVRDISVSRTWQRPVREEPLWRVLRRIARDFDLEIEHREGFLLVRHTFWFFSELQEIPPSEAAVIWRDVARAGKVTIEDESRWAARLSQAQYESLPYLLPGVQLMSYPYLRFRATLLPAQLRVLQGPGVGWAQLRPEQQLLLRRWHGQNYPLRSEDALDGCRVMETTASSEGPLWRVTLPPYQPTMGTLLREQPYDPVEESQPALAATARPAHEQPRD